MNDTKHVLSIAITVAATVLVMVVGFCMGSAKMALDTDRLLNVKEREREMEYKIPHPPSPDPTIQKKRAKF